ncbi:AAA family ATPase [Propionibacteriaceae bacterium Y1685]|uniref:AAA family ATPase n=1 Tax=Microlunatus sp. Y1700 TaxID=3418487 RepID=UPI003B77127A
MTPTVHLLCGLNGAGKTTHAKRLAEELPGVRFTLDEWMLRLYGISFDHPEYAQLVEGCTQLVWDTAQQVIAIGGDVILDWNCWSVERRRLWADRASAAGADVLLHHLTTDLATVHQRVVERNGMGSPHAHRLTPDDVDHLAALFEPPSADEGIPTVTVANRSPRTLVD